MNTNTERQELSFNLREPIVRAAIRAWELAPGSQGLDIGCGIGDITTFLAESVVPTGHVIGVDISPEMVTQASKLAMKSDSSEILSFREGDMNDLPFDDDAFNFTWSVDCVGYASV